MDGEMGIKSEKGKGSTFWFKIPFKRNTKEAYESPTYDILKDVRILIVDDLKFVRDMVTEQLNEKNIHCVDAPSGNKALDMMTAAAHNGHPYEIVIIDYLMPDMNGEILARAIKDDDALKHACLIMLTSAGNPLGDDGFVKRGFSAYIPKPIEHHALISSIATVWSQFKAGKTNVMINVDTGRSLKREKLEEEARVSGAKILIAEDNLVNQIFIKEILEEMEADYTLAANGKEAVEAVQNDTYQLILMDCLMPEMDGWAATGMIRELEKNGIIQHIPICALTHNAMKGDRERCLAAGMDDYLTKPVRKKELKLKVYSMIYGNAFEAKSDESHVSIGHVEHEESSENGVEEYLDMEPLKQSAGASNEEGSSDLLDMEAVEEARSILKEEYDAMVSFYCENAQDYINEIMAAIPAGDIEAIIRPAHTLKSSSKQMGAIKLSDIAKDIEYCAKAIVKGEAAPNQNMDFIKAQMVKYLGLLDDTKLAFEKLKTQ